jgi:starch phosphorylase
MSAAPRLHTPPPNHFDLPHKLDRLPDLAYNLWWTWHADGERVFKWIDPETWEAIGHNPVTFLRQVERHKINAAIANLAYMDLYQHVVEAFDEYASRPERWYPQEHPDRLNSPIAYFSTEFGLHESVPIYAGGLGVLSGDHLKEASDLGLPLVAIGFLYTQGYFSQHISEDGWQEARYVALSFEDLPIQPVLDAEDRPLTISVDLPGREVAARLWRIQVGRAPLYLLDSNVEANQPADRGLTARLYTSDLEMRISQEILLGLGGVRALRALGYNPAVWHLNEGHSAFLALERARELVAAGRSFDEAVEKIRASNVFTTHTPVPAGQDEFPLWMIDKYFGLYWPELGLEREAFIDVGRNRQPWGETFSMPILAIRMSAKCNGVSELHGQVARKMWSFLWPDRQPEQVPIEHITNGIHTATWLARRLHHLFDEYFDPDWRERLDDPEVWEAIDRIPDSELWAVRHHLKRRLVAYVRERARRQWVRGEFHPVQIVASGVLLSPYALTIGFARRFATYKRANLILRDAPRLLEIIGHPDMPVQIIFAGKAHPADEPGKQLIQAIYRQVKQADNGGRLVFLEDYDMSLARLLLQGVDVWLNTPRRPNEASGTSGQKAAVNGVLNFSVLDGWWREGFNGSNGWAIGSDEQSADAAAQDATDAESLYRTLEDEIIPAYYKDLGQDDLPREWIARVRQSIKSLAPVFSTRRMLKEYTHKSYLPAMSAQQDH